MASTISPTLRQYHATRRDMVTAPQFLALALYHKERRQRAELESAGLGEQAETVRLAVDDGMSWTETAEHLRGLEYERQDQYTPAWDSGLQ